MPALLAVTLTEKLQLLLGGREPRYREWGGEVAPAQRIPYFLLTCSQVSRERRRTRD